ncbi:hypothetical protein [Methanobrevibacter sp.]
MKKIITILMFAAIFGLVMGSVAATEHDFDGHFSLDVPESYWGHDMNTEGYKYYNDQGINVEYITIEDINGASFEEYINSIGLENGMADGNFTIFQDGDKYVVVTKSDDEMYIITDKDLDEAKAIAASADLGTSTNDDEASVSVNSTVELESHDFDSNFKMDVPKKASFKETTDSEAQYNGAIVFTDSTNDLNITYVENDEINDKYMDEVISNLEKETGAEVTKNGNLNVVSVGPWNEVIFNDGNKMMMIVSSQLDLDTVTAMAQSVEFTK